MKRLWAVLLLFVCSFAFLGLMHPCLAQQKQGSASPQYGGVLRIVRADPPRVLGYMPEMGPVDLVQMTPAVERIMDYQVDKNGKKQLVPVLAESVTVAKDKRSVTIKLRKGIKFHDGSELNAEAVAWNYQRDKDTGKLQYDKFVTRIEVAGPYTVILHLTAYHNLLLHGIGWEPIFSKQAWDKAAVGGMDKAKEWARTNCVGTGPFKFAEYKRDNYLKFTKNEDYWQKGRPYLDGVTMVYVTDPVTASAMLRAKEADMWTELPVQEQASLEKQGLARNTSFGVFIWGLWPNTKDASSPWRKKEVREAAEYAIDKAAMAKALGFGYYVPLASPAPPGEWGFDPKYKGRSYDPVRAKALLAEAGYPNGLKTEMLVMAGAANTAAATALKRYMDDAGFQVDIDVADPGRFWASIWQKGWKDVAWTFNTCDGNYLLAFSRWFGHDPMTKQASFEQPAELMRMSAESLSYEKENDQKAITEKLVRYMSDEALIIPVFAAYTAYMTQHYVHITVPTIGRWDPVGAWMEKH